VLQDYWLFGLKYRRYLAFGVLLMCLSSFGQTFFIALFGESLRTTFSISDGTLGSVYALATFCSALTLGYVGRFIDHTTVGRFTAGVLFMLVVACLCMASSVNVVMLGFSFYLLRLFGQGLMVHTGLTAAARAFPDHRGKALSLVSLGLPLGEAVFPIIVVASLALFDWRITWAVGACLLAVAGWVALTLERSKPDQRDTSLPQAPDLAYAHGAAAIQIVRPWRDFRFLTALPVIVAVPFIATGFFFHQARLASEKGWALSWVATWFVGYAAVRAVALLGIGPILDRWSAQRILPFFLAPMAIALLLLGLWQGACTVPLYLCLFGVSSAAAGTVGTALWAELYGTAHLGRIRASVEALNVISTGASPMLLGVLVDRGVLLSSQALGCAAYIILASALAAYGVGRGKK